MMLFGEVLGLLYLLQITPAAFSQDLYDGVTLFKSGYGQTCVAGGEDLQTALFWFPPNTRYGERVSEFYPDTSDLSLNCDFEVENECEKFWRVKDGWDWISSENFQFGFVFDRRWEKFNSYRGKTYARGKWFENNLVAHGFKGNYFEMPISVMAKQDLNFFLCDGKSIENSNCYWFLLGGWQGNTTVIRKCTTNTKGKIPIQNSVYAKGECGEFRNETNHPGKAKPLSDSKWRHFIIKKEENMLSIATDKSGMSILEWVDSDPIQNLNHFYTSLRAEGHYKIHKYGMIYTTDAKKTKVGNLEKYTNEEEFCIALYVRMCLSCKMELKLSAGEESSIRNKTIEMKSDIWKESVFNVDIKSYKGLRKILTIETIGEDPNRFWAIDEVRSCTKNDVRFLKTNEQGYKCGTLKRKGSKIGKAITYFLEATNYIINKSFQKNFDSFDIGNASMHCNATGMKSCGGKLICKNNNSAECSCSWGFKWNGNTCTKCEVDRWGFNCEKECKNCDKETCNSESGLCPVGCRDDFGGPYCNESRYPVLEDPPEIIRCGYNDVTLKLPNEKYRGDEEPYRFIFEYRAISEEPWDSSSSIYWDDLKENVINGLNVSTKYEVRGVLFTKENKRSTDNSPSVNFTTDCDGLSAKDVFVDPQNTSAMINITENDKGCLITTYTLWLQEKNQTLENDMEFEIKDLQPYSEYNINFIHKEKANFTMKFKTLEGLPEEIKDLTGRLFENKISLQWKPPERPNGEIIDYVITYQHVKYLACKSDKDQPGPVTNIRVKYDRYEIENLLPYSEYHIDVRATTSIGEGPALTERFKTTPSGYPEEDELPELEFIDISATKVHIQPELDCKKRKGEYKYFINLECHEEWCTTNDIYVEYSIQYNNIISINNLEPYTNYSLKLQLKRLSTDRVGEGVVEKNFTTKPGKPNPATDLMVYSKGERYISLRWKLPLRQNGRFNCTSISYKDTYYQYFVNEYAFDSTCNVWKGFQCFTITRGVYRNYNHFIYLNVKNYDVTEQSETTQISAVPISLVSEPPENLTATFNEQDELTVSWVHPNIMNEKISSFEIYLNDIFVDKVLYEEQLYFSRKLNVTLPPSSETTLDCRAVNIKGKSNKKPIIVYTPPKTPKVGEAHITTITNVTVTIKLPSVENFDNDSYILITLSDPSTTSDERTPTENSEVIKRLHSSTDCINPKYKTRLAYASYYIAAPDYVTLGHDTTMIFKNITIKDVKLEPDTIYGVCIILINEFHHLIKAHATQIDLLTKGYRKDRNLDPKNPENNSGGSWGGNSGENQGGKQGGNSGGNSGLYAFLLLIFVVPLIVWIVWRRKQGKTVIPFFAKDSDNSNSPDVIPLSPASHREDNLPQISIIPKIPIDKPKLKKPTAAEDLIKYTKPINLNDFEEYVKNAIADNELDRQHAMFPRGQTKPWSYGIEKPNKFKNRYNNLIAYDHTRVILERINGDPYSDYINANFIEGYNCQRAYIATQGPKVTTVNDFWRMIWQENVQFIVMLANVMEGGKKKTEQYWPNINETLEFGSISVTFIVSQLFADYEYRSFSVTHAGEERKVQQLHFTSWPDHGVPLYTQSLVPFLRKILTLPQSDSPILVHCSAGVGRTGTIILSDICLRMAAREGKVDVLWHQFNLREQRANMVDNLEQYKLVHMVLLDCLFAPETSIQCDNSFEKAVQKTCAEAIDVQLEYLKKTMWQDQTMRVMLDEQEEPKQFPNKNRFQDITPDAHGRIFIARYPQSDESSSYINAVHVDGFREKDRYVVTQQPLPDTIGDFWRLVCEKKSSVVVSLNEISANGTTPNKGSSCPIFWPTEERPALEPVSCAKLEHVQTIRTEIFDSVTINVVCEGYLKKEEGEKRSVQLILFKNWQSDQILPDKQENLLALCEEVERLARGGGSVIVTCYNGARACGLFTAAAFMIEKIKLEQQCDVCLAVRVIRHNREQFVQNKEQFVYLYELALKYISGFETYSNFVPSSN